ncbi:hypothetical protein [Demequina mangrovi]|uniref:Uncharacterized protein n=1 Tax=Demequina mangrovi TaxID=1043493 RepID=A0A1H7B0M9_9MICO|nr:hypothetical protein [Demequina mangrovi]SEJ71383.1 hypothetical protein SAMN05421637_2782 [Demequina mangrovi]
MARVLRGEARRALVACAAAPCVAALLAGCGDDSDSASIATGYLARQDQAGYIPGARLQVTGTIVALENGCLMLDRDSGGVPWIVWPPSTVPGEQGTAEISDEVYRAGDAVAGTGTVAVLADLPGGNDDDTYFGAQGHYCGADSAGVMVFDSLSRTG